ncbi:MAG: hypothetical protein WAR79_07310, partial [Melioribacteraceae bacterium]
MKKEFRVNGIKLIVGLVLTGLLSIECVDDRKVDKLVLQELDYKENPVDIPNPDRGFERGNDDAAGLGAFIPDKPGGSNYWGYMTISVSANTIL